MKSLKKYLCSRHFLCSLVALIALVACFIIDSSGSSGIILCVVTPMAAAGVSVSGEPLTTDVTREGSPDLLLDEIDKRITKMRPMRTPIDQLSRQATAKHSGSMTVAYYSVDTKPGKSKLVTAYTEPASNATTSAQQVTIDTANNDLFEVSEDVMVKGVKGYEEDGVTISSADLIVNITTKSDDGKIIVRAVNGKKISETMDCVPSIPVDTELIRMGRAAAELDVQTGQFETLPTKEKNNCQIFKMQVEQSTFQSIANKEVDWKFSDMEESAVYDMRMGMERSYMFGVSRIKYDPKKKANIYHTGGIWWQAESEFEYDPNAAFSYNDLVDMQKKSFSGDSANDKKLVFAGSGLIARINKLEANRVIQVGSKFEKWDLSFKEVGSTFGSWYIMRAELFDLIGMEDCGFVLDPEYLDKWNHVPFSRLQLDLQKAGIRNTDAVVLSEASCLTLKYPKAHMRIVPKK